MEAQPSIVATRESQKKAKKTGGVSTPRLLGFDNQRTAKISRATSCYVCFT